MVKRLAVSEPVKFAPGLRARTIWKSKSSKTEVEVAKLAPGLRARAIRKSKRVKSCGVGALFEAEVCKICTTLWRESGLEAKIVKNWLARTTF